MIADGRLWNSPREVRWGSEAGVVAGSRSGRRQQEFADVAKAELLLLRRGCCVASAGSRRLPPWCCVASGGERGAVWSGGEARAARWSGGERGGRARLGKSGAVERRRGEREGIAPAGGRRRRGASGDGDGAGVSWYECGGFCCVRRWGEEGNDLMHL
jgi:hypothetical protein